MLDVKEATTVNLDDFWFTHVPLARFFQAIYPPVGSACLTLIACVRELRISWRSLFQWFSLLRYCGKAPTRSLANSTLCNVIPFKTRERVKETTSSFFVR